MDVKYDKQSLWHQRGHGNDLYHCVYHSVVHITMTCSTTQGNIYFAIIFFTILARQLHFLSSVLGDTVWKKKRIKTAF